MASMNVKVPVAKVITLLETKLKQLKVSVSEYNKAVVQHKKNKEAYKKAVQKFRPKGTPVVEIVRRSHWNTLTASYDYTTTGVASVVLTYKVDNSLLPVEPTEPKEIGEARYDRRTRTHVSAEQDVQEQIEGIEQALRVLKLTDDETVSASTFKNISQYL